MGLVLVESPEPDPEKYRVLEWRLLVQDGDMIYAYTFDRFEDMREVYRPGDTWEEWQRISSHVVLESEAQREDNTPEE